MAEPGQSAPPKPTAIELEDQALGDWPRRLLHVPSMTCYEWQAGNVYGAVQEPLYNALTYTWGRWRLQEHEQPAVRAVGIRGVPWAIPRIDPRRFTAADFASVIRRATEPRVQWRKPGGATAAAVDFLWLDVACIDQRGSDPRSAAEIGRQLPIFKKARQVFAWLHELPSAILNPALAELDRGTDVLSASAGSSGPDQSVLDSIHHNLRIILQDPWFSSLWTLQEAFLRPDCILFSREGTTRSTALSESGKVRYDTLLDFLGCCENVLFAEPSGLPPPFEDAVQLIKDRGLAALMTFSALAVYTATSRRTAARDEDRIYGIQQVFGFRLGGSAAAAAPGAAAYTRARLELELGEQLLRRHPVLSQMHVFTEPAREGRAFLVTPQSAVPADLRGFVRSDLAPATSECIEEPRAALSVRLVGHNPWGHFRGLLCAFPKLVEACGNLERHSLWEARFDEANTYLSLELDVTPALSSCPEYRSSGYKSIPRGRRQRSLARWFTNDFVHRQSFFVLLLGLREADDQRVMIGVLLVLRHGQSSPYYHRVGLCWWDATLTMVGGERVPGIDYGTLMGVDGVWEQKSGYFG